jgi:hypothetical protein
MQQSCNAQAGNDDGIQGNPGASVLDAGNLPELMAAYSAIFFLQLDWAAAMRTSEFFFHLGPPSFGHEQFGDMLVKRSLICRQSKVAWLAAGHDNQEHYST